MEEGTIELINYGTRDLFIEILNKLQWPYTTGDDLEFYDICFEYRGETFYASAMNEIESVDIFDPFWYSMDLNDKKGFAMLKEVINAINSQSSIVNFYEVNRKRNKVYVHSKMELYINNLPDVEKYVRVSLNSLTLIRRRLIFSIKEMREGKRPYLKERRRLSALTSKMIMNSYNYWNDDFRIMSEQTLLKILDHPNDYDEDYLDEIKFRLDLYYPQRN